MTVAMMNAIILEHNNRYNKFSWKIYKVAMKNISEEWHEIKNISEEWHEIKNISEE